MLGYFSARSASETPWLSAQTREPARLTYVNASPENDFGYNSMGSRQEKLENFEIVPMGEGFTWETKDREQDTKIARETWAACREAIEKNEHDLLIFDEINNALAYDYLEVTEVIDVLQGRSEDMHVILTGRDAPQELIDFADLVTEMREIKHPFQNGIYAQRGIEY